MKMKFPKPVVTNYQLWQKMAHGKWKVVQGEGAKGRRNRSSRYNYIIHDVLYETVVDATTNTGYDSSKIHQMCNGKKHLDCYKELK